MTIFLYSVFTCEDTTFFPAIDQISSPLISDSIVFTPEVIYNKIINLHNSKIPGPDGCPFPIIKAVSLLPSNYLLYSRNHNSGILPHDWKNTQVTPIHKNVLETKFATIVQLISHPFQ